MNQTLQLPLSDAECDDLEGFLARVDGGAIPNLETLDGFMTALVVCPDLVKPSEYMDVIRSGRDESGDLVFDDVFQAERFYGLLMRHWNTINRTLREGKPYMPLLNEGSDGITKGNDWAKGFLEGTRLRQDIWEEVINDDGRGGPFIPIFALAHENDPDESLRPYKEPVSPEQREKLLIGMIAGVRQLYDGFQKDRRPTLQAPTTIRRSVLKVGRNDPCPCGSGKKFKKCCGQTTIH